VFRRAPLLPGETVDYVNNPLVPESFQPALDAPEEVQPQVAVKVEPLPDSDPIVQQSPHPVAAPSPLQVYPPQRSARRPVQPHRVHLKATRVVQSGATVIRL